MKKRLLTALSVITAVSMLSGCAGTKTTYGKYLKLGEYKGLEVTKIKTETDEEDIDLEIESLLEENAVCTDVDRGAKDGDQVNIDFTGTLDGEAFEDGTDTDYDLILGSDDFGEAFEEQLLGAKAGDTVTVTQVFDEEYEDELVGKTAVYEVKVNAVQEITIPELTDEYCKEHTDYDTVEAYRAALAKELAEYNEENSTYTAGSDALSQIISNSEFDGYPQELYDTCLKEYNESNEAMAEMFGMDVSDFVSEDDAKTAVTELVHTQMVVTEIAEKENITVSDEEYQKYIDSVYEESGYASAEEYEADYTKDSIMYEALYNKVIDFIMENAKITEVSEDEYYGDSDEEFDLDDLDFEDADFDDADSDDEDSDDADLDDADFDDAEDADSDSEE